MVKSTMAMNYTDTSRSREGKTNAIAINNTSQQVNKLRDDFNEFNNHIAVSNNNFSIYKVNTIAKLFSAAINKLNYTLNLINAKKEDIIRDQNYSGVISPILESKFGKVDPITNESGIILFTIAKNNAFYYFYEEYPEFNNKYVNSLPEPYKTLGNDIDAKYYDSRIQLASQNNQSIYYMWVFKLWEKGIQLNIDVLLPDVLQQPGKFIVMATTIEITTKIPNITNYATIPSSLINYLTSIQNSFNAYSKNTYDSTLGTTYQFGPNSKFNTLKVVSSVDYPQWNGQYIVDSYIPGSNIDMPNIIYQINTELNRSYTGVQDGQIVIVGYALDSIYYTGVVKMVTDISYGLCYQLQSININELFDRSVKMTGDVRIQGNLDVSRYDGVTVISTDNTRKVTTIQDKVGINQASHEVNGLLDIDNMTQQIVLDLFQNFVPYSLNSYDIMSVIKKSIANKLETPPYNLETPPYNLETPPYTHLSQFPIGKTDNIIYNSGSHNLDLYIPNHKTKSLVVVLYVHGGSFVSGNEEDKDALRAMARFNSEGYITCSMAYSLQHPPTGGFTLNWWINAVVKATNDLVDAIEYIKSLGATGLHIVGYSAGAIMVLMTALNNTHPFINILKQVPPNFILTRTSIGGSLITPDDYSMVQYLDANCPPLLLWNGTADKTVDQKGARAIKQRYTDLGKSENCQLYLLDGSTHSSILTDTYKGKNALDVSITFVGLSLFTPITEMFAQGNSLFDYTNQCTVFSVPIKPLFDMSAINIIHGDSINVGLHVDGMGMAMGIGKSILSNNYTLRILQQRVKEVNQMKSEIIRSSDNSNIFSFIDLVCNDDKNWYVVSMRAITDIMPMSDINSNSNMLFVMTYINVTNIMIDQSYYTVFTKLFDYVSRECRFMNYVALLFKNNNTNSSNNSSNNTNRWVDASGNLSNDASGNPLITLAIKNNEYFSSRLGLLPESYIYLYTLGDDTSGNDNIFTLHESNPHWNGYKASDCWNGDSNVGVLVNIINDQQYQLYNNRQNSIFAVNYVWTSFRKVAFINLITINNVRYILGSGFNLNSLLGPTMVVRGDNSVSGNFYVNDSADNNIFKVDNVTKTISNLYKVGIGMSELPKSILDIKDTTVQDILNEVDVAIEQWRDMNILVGQLRDASSEEVFGEIITNNSSLPPTTQQYYAIARLNLETMLSTDTILIYHWLMPHWENKLLGEIEDPINQFPLRNIKLLYQQILDNETIFDGRIIGSCVNDIFGWKLSRRICFRNRNNGHMYFLTNGTNVQNYGIRYNTNNNLPMFYEQRILTGMTLSEVVRRIRNVTDVINKAEGLNTLITMTNKYSETKTRRSYEIVINLSDIFDVTVRDIYMDLNTPDNIEFGNSINSKDFGYNERVKFSNFYIKLMNKYGIRNKDNNTNTIKPNDYFILYYDDLDVDYIGVINCIKVDGSNITLVVSEFSIQEYIQPSLNVTGDAKVIGDLMVTNQTTKDNYVSISPGQRFFGVNTDERFINYSDMLYTTTTNRYTPKHNVYIKNDAYPVMVSERICEDASGTDVSNNDYIKFGSYTAFTVKRKSNIYDYSTLARYADKLDEAFHEKHSTDTVTRMRYGPDISFELCDKDNKTVELGQLQLTLDGIDASGNLQCGFGVSVNDYARGAEYVDIRRNIIYVDNSSTLFVKQINLNGGILSTSTDGSNNLLWNGKKLLTEP